MSMAVTTSRVACPLCGEGATLTVHTEFGDGREFRTMALQCSNGCEPENTELDRLMKVQRPA